MAERIPFVSIEKVARWLGKDSPYHDNFSSLELNVLYDIALSVESLLEKTMGLRLSNAVHVEYLPASGMRNNPDVDLEDYDYENGKVYIGRNGSGRSTLQLGSTPVMLDGLKVWEDVGGNADQAMGAFSHETELVLGDDFYLDLSAPGRSDSGILHRISSVWSTQPRSIKVEYRGGPYAAEVDGVGGGIPAIEMAIVKAVSHNFLFWKRVNTSQSPGGGLISGESLGKYSYTLGGPKGDSGVEYGGFSVSIPDEIFSDLSAFFNWGNVL